MVKDINLEKKISDAAEKNTVAVPEMQQDDMMMQAAAPNKRNRKQNDKAALSKKNLPLTTLYVAGNTNTVSQVAGIIIGSPEFQRK
jgi:hypothetical protein